MPQTVSKELIKRLALLGKLLELKHPLLGDEIHQRSGALGGHFLAIAQNQLKDSI